MITRLRSRLSLETSSILFPFLLSRLLLLFVGWSARLFPGVAYDPTSDVILSTNRFIDMWARWDTNWYVRIIREGYTLPATGYSPTAFFPLYSYVVAYVQGWLAPGASPDGLLVIGILLSNAFFLAALLLVYRLVMVKTGDQGAAYRTVLYLCLAPLSFIFSSFYPEALFLLLTVGAFYAAERRAWGWVAAAACLVGLTRPIGVLLGLPLLLIWRDQHRRGEASWAQALAALLTPVGLLIFMAILQHQVGEPLSFMSAGATWSSRVDWPWRAFTSDLVQKSVHNLNIIVALLFIGLAVAAFRFGPAYGLWALTVVIGSLTLKGNLVSIIRYVMVAFPAFMVLGQLGGHSRRHEAILITFTALLSLLMALWSEGFFVV